DTTIIMLLVCAILSLGFGIKQHGIEDGQLGIGIVPYSPLGHGFFGGRAVEESVPANSVLGILPRFQSENLERNKILYLKVKKLAEKHGCTPAQLALAWVLHQGDDVVPIPGTTKIKNLDSNIDSLRLKLTEEDLKEISDVIPINEVAGCRTLDTITTDPLQQPYALNTNYNNMVLWRHQVTDNSTPNQDSGYKAANIFTLQSAKSFISYWCSWSCTLTREASVQ
ncbi:NADP-dependent oxidoreductase domain - like 10, partial [Theobroma cacao]